MSDGKSYFGTEAGQRASAAATFVDWDGLDPLEIVPGLGFQPVLGKRVMVNFVRFEPHTEAPLHWHEEEQITFVIEGELEFEAGEETRTLRRGDAVVIPSNVPHAARTHDGTCLEVDVFHPPRRGILEAMESAAPRT